MINYNNINKYCLIYFLKGVHASAANGQQETHRDHGHGRVQGHWRMAAGNGRHLDDEGALGTRCGSHTHVVQRYLRDIPGAGH